MVPQVVDDTLDGATVEEVAIGVGQLRLEHPSNAPAGDGVGERERKHAHDCRQQVSEYRSVKDITEQEGGEREIAESKIERQREVVANNTDGGFARADRQGKSNCEPIGSDCHS